MQLNELLATKQKITDKQRDNLEVIYNDMTDLLALANADENLDKNGPKYATTMKDIEFKLQENWNFPKDPLCHTWWNRFNGCLCPKMDNTERFGVEKIITCDCPFHNSACKKPPLYKRLWTIIKGK